jgi:hypothetical protein
VEQHGDSTETSSTKKYLKIYMSSAVTKACNLEPQYISFDSCRKGDKLKNTEKTSYLDILWTKPAQPEVNKYVKQFDVGD